MIIQIRVRIMMPIDAFNPIAKVTLVAFAIAPIITIPIGPAPIAMVIMPNALPRMSSLAASMTIVDCIVPNPAVPRPMISMKQKDTEYDWEKEKAKRLTRPIKDPPT